MDLHTGKNILGILLCGKTDFYAILTFICIERHYFFLNREVKGSKEKVISDKDLELLLDRSDLIGKSEVSFVVFVVFFLSFCSTINSYFVRVFIGRNLP